MAALDKHPTVVAVRNRPAQPAPGRVSASWLREVCLAAGADDVGFVAIDRTEIGADKADILTTFPATKTLISIICRMNREPVRNPARSVHLIFTGAETAKATVTIRNQSLDVRSGLVGTPDCTIQADAATWLGFLRRERSIVWAIIRRKVRVTGGLSRLKDFGRCFPV